jgi:LEA14-like dessication related protein
MHFWHDWREMRPGICPRCANALFMLRRAGLVVLVGAVLASCAGMGLREPLRVNLAGLESIPGEGMEARFLAKVRVQNPNDVSIAYSGLSAEVDLNGKSFASGVSDATGEIPRFGESVIEIPLTVPATAIVRQVLGLVSDDRSKATYRVRGFLNTGTFGRAPFDSTGEIELPKPALSSN